MVLSKPIVIEKGRGQHFHSPQNLFLGKFAVTGEHHVNVDVTNLWIFPFNRDVSHHCEYDNEHVIKSFFFVSRCKSRLDSKGINPWTICICSDSKELK
jgi:hypothetical protein